MKQVSLGNLDGRIAYARFLHDHSEIPLKQHDGKNRHAFEASPGSVTLSLPVEPPEVLLPLIELILKPGAAASVAGGESFEASGESLLLHIACFFPCFWLIADHFRRFCRRKIVFFGKKPVFY